MTRPKWRVHKFGGTSVGNADRYKGVASILRSEPGERKGVVVSAMTKVTDALIETATLAAKRDESYEKKLEALKLRHLETAVQLATGERLNELVRTLENDFRDLAEVLRGVFLLRSCSERTLELVSGFGELWSAQFLNACLKGQGFDSCWLDARQVLVVEHRKGAVAVNWEESEKRIQAWGEKNSCPLVVITGFIASASDGIPTTLGRNGSDYSGSIFGALLDAEEITIWTDVDGVLSADPRLVPEAVVLDELSYHEVTELAYFGAKVVHPGTMYPAIRKRIPIWIRNTFNPKHPGTKIHADAKSSQAVKGFSTIDNMALINVEGTGMMGVPGVAERLFGALGDVGVSVVMISQASSEQSICFAVPQAQAELAKKTVEQAFFAELHQGQIQAIDVSSESSILAVVGDNMAERPGVAASFFTALGKAGVNIRAIAQGSSERNISVVVPKADSKRALRAVHSAYYLSDQTLSIGLIGPGLIGKTILKQVHEQQERLRRERKIDLRIRAIIDSKRMLLGDPSIPLGDWQARFEASTTPRSMEEFTRHLNDGQIPHPVIIDATASAELTSAYPGWLESGFNLITPNKKANTAGMQFYLDLKQMARSRGKYYLYHTTCGAGLPVISTLRDLIQTGDRIQQIEGVLSGTLSYIFNTYSGSPAFSEVVRDAQARGFTEPDPRDDLSGMDVARKLVILAREMGLETEVSEVEIESLVPAELRAGSVADYFSGLPKHDREMSSLLERSRASDEVLRYVGVIDSQGKASVKLRSYPRTHAFARLGGSDNIVAFTTERYNKQPLIVQGPGAGPEVTAAGVFADLLRLAAYFGAPL